MDRIGVFRVSRAKPADAEAIAAFVGEATRGRVSVVPHAVVERFGLKGLWLVRDGSGEIVALAGWRAENLIARVDDFLVHPPNLYTTAGKLLIDKIEKAAYELQCEVCMLFMPVSALPTIVSFCESCGYRRPEPEELPRVWQETVQEATDLGRFILLKQLRQDLVLRPI